MVKLDPTLVATVQATLAQVFAGNGWQGLLETVAVTGVADALQLRAATGLSRDRLATALDKLNQAAPGLPPILSVYAHKVVRPGGRGAPPRVFVLGETGAALLRQLGHAAAHACRLQDPAAIAHALAILDVYLLAQQARLTVAIEARLPAAETIPYILPDALVTLPDGTPAVLEIEQLLTPQHIARAIESVQHKLAFYKSPAGRAVSPVLRTLYNLPAGPDYDRTLKVWRQALRAVQQRNGGTLPFRFLAAPLNAFKAAPDWSEPPTVTYSTDLRAPPSPTPTPSGSSLATPNSPLASRPPKALRRYTTHESALLLNALWQNFLDVAAEPIGQFPRPDVALFEVAGIIYAASHDRFLSPLERAAYPRASLYLFDQYLRLHAPLRELLSHQIPRGAQVIRWNTIAITHRMQVVCARFLQYHGFSDRGPLLVRATSADYAAQEPQCFQVRVTIQEPELLLLGDGVLPDRQMVRTAEAALAWVLTALFLYAEDLGLPQLPFW